MLEDRSSADRARARAARRARPLPPGDLDVPVADAGLPLLARDRRAPGRPRDPAPRLVPPRRAAARRVRLVVRRRPRGRHEAVADRHRLRAQRQPPRPERGDGLRGARGRGADGRGGQHHLLPRSHRAPADRPRPRAHPARRMGPKRFFFYNLFESDVTGAPLVGAQPAARDDRRLRRRGRALARHARRLRLPRLLPLRLRLRLARAGPGRRARRARSLRRRRRRADRGRRRGRTSSSSATPSSSAPTTARRRWTRWRGSRSTFPDGRS